MYLWRRLASGRWWIENEERLRRIAKDRLTIIEQPNRKLLLLEAAFESRSKINRLRAKFGGQSEKLSSDWLKRFLSAKTIKLLKIGNRLIIDQSSRNREASSLSCGLIIPAGAAFGTGGHPTTAMSLQLLEKATREWKSGWRMVDLGTGSGILALAAVRFGAKQSIAIDLDPLAVSTAKGNAHLNKIDNVKFRVADVRRWKSPAKVDMVAANLFSELLIEILPKLKRSRFLVLSGILRNQEMNVRRALYRNKVGVVQVRRRGKWIAILGKSRAGSRTGHLKLVGRRRAPSLPETS